ncbi:uncharacterized protein [Neodiprion pinetum]|uniref:uncharacterized protein isoform X1 n=1 Tax=Neodiprion pinetum TaxID=441929 RepID=UPI001EDD88CC|nr:uncharacterized protein LOC124222631 isoform X1 [Neodiprion pinetum]
MCDFDGISKQEDAPMDEQQHIKDVIATEIETHQRNLSEVKDIIRESIEKYRNESSLIQDNDVIRASKTYKFGIASILLYCLHFIRQSCYNIFTRFYKRLYKKDSEQREMPDNRIPLSTIDHSYIDRKYVKYCLRLWLREVENFISDTIINNSSIDIISDILNSLDTVHDLICIPAPLNQLMYYKLLIQNYKIIGNDNEKIFVKKFKANLLRQIILGNTSIRNELDFITAFIDFLCTFKSIQSITEELKLHDFISDCLPFKEFLHGLTNLEAYPNCKKFANLQEIAGCLETKKDFILTKKLKEVISAYIKPIEIQRQKLDGRLVIEVMGKRIAVSKILTPLERELLRNNIEEVRIVGADVLYIDADLKNKIWHGKNLIIFVKSIKIDGNVTWDVSGQDNNHIYSDNAGTAGDGHGKQGADGFAGESGGNVLLQADDIENPKNLVIISHGGKGSGGQNGGHGKDGKDGQGISRADFDRTFPSVVKFWTTDETWDNLLRKTIFAIKDRTKFVGNDYVPSRRNYFIREVTEEGNEITFSYCARDLLTNCQAYLLYTGSPGQPGGNGGEYGLGGQGGYGGELMTNNPHIVFTARQGEDGRNGNGGYHGKYGRNGWDMGYTDYQLWPETKFYGRDQNIKLNIEYHTLSPDDAVWCPYMGKYATIRASNIHLRRSMEYKMRNNVRQNCEHQHQANPTRKKTISQSKISTDYSHHFSSVTANILSNLQASLNNINQIALQAMAQNIELQEEVTTEVRVQCHIKSSDQNINFRCKNITPLQSTSGIDFEHSDELDVQSVIDRWKNHSLSENWHKLKYMEANKLQLDELISALEIIKCKFFDNQESQRRKEHNALLDIENLLNSKYRFTILQEIARQLPMHDDITYQPKVTPERAAIYLVVGRENEDDSDHQYLGSLSQYIYQDGKKKRTKVFQFCERKLHTVNYEAWWPSVRAFVIEAGKLQQIDPDLGKYCNQYVEFLAKQEHSLNIFFDLFESELKRHSDIYSLWIDAKNNPFLRDELRTEMSKHPFLNALHNRFIKQLGQMYNWKKCCEDQKILKKWRDHIRKKGPLSESYRELLAHVFNVNIRLYVEDQDNKLHLFDNHKPSSRQNIHILLRGSKFIQLKFNKNYLDLENARNKTESLYAYLFAKFKLLNKKDDYDKFLDIQSLLSDQRFFGNDYYTNTEETERLQSPDTKVITSKGSLNLEVGRSNQIYSGIEKYYYDCEESSKTQQHGLDVFFECFHNELKRHEHVFALWIESIKQPFVKNELEIEIQKHDFLNALYNRFINELGPELNLSKYANDAVIFRESNNYIPARRLLSKSCADLHYDLVRQDHELETEYINQSNTFIQVFAQIASFDRKEEFAEYLKKQIYASSSNFLKHDAVSEEQEVIAISEYFSVPEEQSQIKERLEKITSQYSGYQGILRTMSKRFANDGRHVSFQELCCLVNSILNSVIEDRNEQNTFSWIIAAYPQKNWIDELVLLEIENFLQRPSPHKSKWREYLSQIQNKEVLSLFRSKLNQQTPICPISNKCIEDTLHLLIDISDDIVGLEELKLSEWPYALKEKYWTHKLSLLTNWQQAEILSEASYYLLSMDNTFGTNMTEKFLQIIENKDLSSDSLTNILSNFHSGKWNLNEETLDALSSSEIGKWREIMDREFVGDGKERDVKQLIKLIIDNANTSQSIHDKLPEIENYISNIDKQMPATNVNPNSTSDIMKDVLAEKSRVHEKRMAGYEDNLQLLVKIDGAIESKRGFKLRDTQKLAILALLSCQSNTLAQVSTGEGKSLIVVAVSIILARRGQKVDVITSSSVLAKRDAEINKDIYEFFDVSVSHNCNENIEKRREAYSSSQVVFGDLSSFQRDYLQDRFYGQNILGDRNFENVIVDEVDSMLLDKGNNMLYLSHDLAGLDKLQSIYIYIWQWVSRPAKSQEDLSLALDAKLIKEAVLKDLYGVLTKEDIRKLSSELDEQQVKMIWECLIEAKILDDSGKMLIHDDKFEILLPTAFNAYKSRLRYLLKECITRDRFIYVPNYLKPFIEEHLESWINNAVIAVGMRECHDYIIDVDRTGTSSDLNPNITILDRDTGTDQANSQWDEALHQFLQLKHGCKLSTQSLKAIFISNVSYLKCYRHLYGLTGTLGSQRERELLQEIHEVDFVTIPTARQNKFYEDIPRLCTTKEKWIEEIFLEATKLTAEKERSVLIICETIDDANTLHKEFIKRGATNVHTYTRDYEEFDIAKGKPLEQRQIIIATNLSGRGTDIKITPELRKAGGLHVCLTYLPNNSRVEQQAFGRTSRNGDEGSGQLIIMVSGLKHGNSKILDLKKQRDAGELYRISEIKAYYETQITIEERCLNEFQTQYESLKSNLDKNNVGTEITKILLQSCLDRWAFWLDGNNKCIKNLTDEYSKASFEKSLKNFTNQLKQLRSRNCKDWLLWVDKQPVHMIKLGKYFIKNKPYTEAIKLFEKVIDQEPHFSEAAHYYKAFAMIKTIDWENNSADEQNLQQMKSHLRNALRLFNEHSNFSMYAASFITNMKQYNYNSIVQIDTYAEQQKSLSHLYSIFAQSIDDILGQPVTAESFINDDFDEELAEFIYEDLLAHNILKMPSIKTEISEEALNRVSFDCGILIDELKKFVSVSKGKEIDEKLLSKLKNDIKLPSKESFWKLSVEENILCEEIKCIIINVEKMEQVDPSLLNLLRIKIEEKELKRQTLECNDENEIALHGQQDLAQNNFNMEPNDCIILEKSDFKAAIANNDAKYRALKKKEVIWCNKKACVNFWKIASTNLPYYDSVTPEDFISVNIPENDADQILAELVEQRVLAKDKSTSNVYRLIIPYYEIDQIQLPSYPLYQNAVRSLLPRCFNYRIALQTIKTQFDTNQDVPMCLHLPSRPHNKLVFELTDQRIISFGRVNKKTVDFEKSLKGIYNKMLTVNELKAILFQNKIIPPIKNIKALCNHLVTHGWLSQHESKYSINDSNQRKALTKFKNIEETMRQILNSRLQLVKQETLSHVIKTLQESVGTLKSFYAPDSHLKPLTEHVALNKLVKIEEVRIFNLNGLDEILLLEEKKCTRKMIFNAATVIVGGVCQIGLGTAIENFSMGVMKNFSSAFFTEGISDIWYGISAAKSGYVNWKDYKQHKIQSLIFTTITCGVGPYFPRGTKVSVFGHKITGPSLELGGKASASSSYELMTAVGRVGVARGVGKRITSKTLIAMASELAKAGIDMLVKKKLQVWCNGIRSKILSDIEKEVGNHCITAKLEAVYRKLGRVEARKLINDLTERFFTKRSIMEIILPVACNIVYAVTQKISNAIKQLLRAEKCLQNFLIQTITKILALIPAVKYLVKADNVRKLTNNFLITIDKELEDLLDDNESQVNSNLETLEEEQKVENSERFKNEVIAEWNSLLRDKAGQVIEEEIVRPIFNEGVVRLVRYCENVMKNQYQTVKGRIYNKHLEQLKQCFQKDHKSTYIRKPSSQIIFRSYIENEYHKNLLKLTAKKKKKCSNELCLY